MKKVLFLLVLSILVVSGCSIADLGQKKDVLELEEAKVMAEDYINNNLMQPGSEATVKDIVEENGLFKLTVDVGGQDVDSYLTLDGKIFFPQAMETEQVVENETADNSQPVDTNVPKSDKPVVEVFVMSHCPYGTQIEKGIIPVVETLGDKIDFQLKFVDYAMHGEKELDEELNQYCIQKNEPNKLITYLKCFLEDSDGAGCLASTGINNANLQSCVSATDEEFEVKSLFADKSTWSGGRYPQFNVHKAENDKYGITGSPGLVINGTKSSAGRDSASLLSNICAAFNEQPSECSEKLSSASPSPGFGFAASGSATDATCN